MKTQDNTKPVVFLLRTEETAIISLTPRDGLESVYKTNRIQAKEIFRVHVVFERLSRHLS
jgi:hypothetical protein